MDKKIISGVVIAIVLVIVVIGIIMFTGLLKFDRSGQPEIAISLVSPNDGDQFETGSTVYVLALVNAVVPQDSSPALAEISFWINGSAVATVPVEDEVNGDYSAKTEWVPLAPGSYSLVARATLSNEQSFDSELVVVTVVGEDLSPTAVPTATLKQDMTGVAETQAAEETQNAAATAAAAATDAVEADQRCSLFDPENTTLTMLDMPMLTTDLTIYIEMPSAVPGLEVDIAGDTDVWEYSAILGSQAANSCEYWGYSQRLYCVFDDLPLSYLDSSQPLEVYVNHCSTPIYSHDRASVLLQACDKDLNEDACDWTGGDWTCTDKNDEDTCSCVCDD